MTLLLFARLAIIQTFFVHRNIERRSPTPPVYFKVFHLFFNRNISDFPPKWKCNQVISAREKLPGRAKSRLAKTPSFLAARARSFTSIPTYWLHNIPIVFPGPFGFSCRDTSTFVSNMLPTTICRHDSSRSDFCEKDRGGDEQRRRRQCRRKVTSAWRE